MFVGFSVLMALGFILGFVVGFTIWVTPRSYMENKNE